MNTNMPIESHRGLAWMTLIGMLAFCGAMVELAGRVQLHAPPLALAPMTDDEICQVVRGNWMCTSVNYLHEAWEAPAYPRILLMAEPANVRRTVLHASPGYSSLNIRYLGFDPLRREWEPRPDSEPGWLQRDAPDRLSIWFGPSGSALHYDLTITSDELILSGSDLSARFRRTW